MVVLGVATFPAAQAAYDRHARMVEREDLRPFGSGFGQSIGMDLSVKLFSVPRENIENGRADGGRRQMTARESDTPGGVARAAAAVLGILTQGIFKKRDLGDCWVTTGQPEPTHTILAVTPCASGNQTKTHETHTPRNDNEHQGLQRNYFAR